MKKPRSAPKKSARPAAKRTPRATSSAPRPACGLCGKTTNLMRTDCCNNWICDDEHTYRLFSYARNSCARNHSRFTLCGCHFNEGHTGNWKTCPKCREQFEHELEMYVYYGTNEYNFEILENPPAFEPTHCDRCGAVIVLPDGGYSFSADGYRCGDCMDPLPF